MIKVLVTGINGFIGRALAQRMLTEGWQVRGTFRSAKRLKGLPRAVEALHTESIGPDTEWSEALTGVDIVVHLAARVHKIYDTATEPLTEFRHVNVAATNRLARMAAAKGCRRFIFMSSIKVNGEETLQPYTEKDTPTPSDPYGISKWEAEQVLQEIGDRTGMEVVLLRPPLVYGPGVKANFLRLIEWVDRGIPLPLKGVKNKRSFIYVENLVDAVVTCTTHPGAAGQTYLLSDNEDVSTPELIRRIAAAIGRPIRLFTFPIFPLKTVGMVTGKSTALGRIFGSLTVDCKKIQIDLDWKVPYTMDEGLSETAKWYLKAVKNS